MKRIAGVLLMCMAVTCVQAQSWLKKEEQQPKKSKGWITDFEQARKESAAHGQPIFAFFTGSDWCGWCVRLHEEVLGTKEFERFAADNLILFEADFPRGRKLSDKLVRQNEALANKYGVRGFPTIYLLDAEGSQLGRTGYKQGGAAAYVEHLKELLDRAGIKAKEGGAASKPLSAYEKMKAEKAAGGAPKP
jgi:protein disulfide-isomerase